MKPAPELWDLLAGAYPCPAFSGVCKCMRWAPEQGQIPRGFLGATGELSEVELVLVFAEPGDPHPGDHETLEDALAHAYRSFKSGSGVFHRKARDFFNLCWPGLSFDDQLKRVWMTESVLCSAEWSTGPVPMEIEKECGRRYLKQQIALFQNALVVALGHKAQDRLTRIECRGFERAYAFGLPGCNQQGALPSWLSVAEKVRSRRGDLSKAEPVAPLGTPRESKSPKIVTKKNDPSASRIKTPRSIHRRTMTSEEAKEYTQDLLRQADALGVPLTRWLLGMGRPNDVRVGVGPRFAIIQTAQELAKSGATYGAVLGREVIQGNGKPYVIKQHDLAWFVCANGYCTIEPPMKNNSIIS